MAERVVLPRVEDAADVYLGRDQNLVIARWKGELMARRVVKSKGFQGVSLSAQMPDPRHSMPTRSFEEDKVQLHRIVGVVFTEMPPPDGAKGEAVTVDDVPELGDVEIAYRVREESAVPLVLPGQTVLGGRKLALDDLDRHRGRLVAVTLDDGTSVLKRVGSRLPGSLGHLRHFETVGSLGESLVAAVEPLEGTPDVSVIVSARAVVAVLYEGS